MKKNINIITERNKVFETRVKPSCVTIVGFGPGDPNLLTIKGEKALKNADVIFYDDLIDKSYLGNFLCEKIYVGKRKGNHYKEQLEINKLLHKAALTGKKVVRLKGGDPSIFSRLGEEIQFLKDRSINVVIIPGITTASAASAILGTSLTQRGVSKSVAFCSGHKMKDIKIPNAETLVFYMATSNLDKICQKLISSDWKKETPLAIISRVSFPDQEIYIGTIKEFTTNKKIITPSIIIVGEVVEKDFITKYINQKAKAILSIITSDKYHANNQAKKTELIIV
ncbi:MAG: uroporphyrinogen-III C-methyltransferase [Deltaproteobacteria bacterium]|nr:uroporphyrinogen-III C-methyltransferase [Deltaproteobacteria bacterium]